MFFSFTHRKPYFFKRRFKWNIFYLFKFCVSKFSFNWLLFSFHLIKVTITALNDQWMNRLKYWVTINRLGSVNNEQLSEVMFGELELTIDNQQKLLFWLSVLSYGQDGQ